ncbi:MAG TPA: Snf7 family protein [Nitrosopumilaceae archaeon]|nr:Snf7 family protein [Nitrosopumilaceae archaeon]
MTGFQNKWSKPPTPGLSERINDALKPKGPLKPRVEMAIKRLRGQISKLDNMLSKLKERDEKIFQRVVIATQQHDTQTSKVLSNELAEIRKVSKILGNARMALEQIELRLTTAHDLGDTVVTIMPTIGLMKNLKSSLAKFMPGADQEINKMAEMLGGLMTETFSGDATFGIDESTNAESDKILQEAAAVAESTVDNKFPNTPMDSEVPSTTSRFM